MSYQPCPSPRDRPGPSPAIELLIESRPRDLGGFSVRRLLPSGRRRLIGPFIFFDHIGPVDFAPSEGLDVRPHPHIGLATVTYLFEGEILHRDSLGCVQPIRPGAVNWMTAGRGIVHSERTPPERRQHGSRLHGIQSWVALPREHEEVEPAFVHHPGDSLPCMRGDGTELRLIAGSAYGAAAPVAVLSPMFYIDATLAAGAAVGLPESPQRAVYVVDGAVAIGDQRLERGSMAVLSAACPTGLIAREASRVMLLGGDPVGDRHIWWNFVSSSAERLEQAKADWKHARFAKVPGETEFIPLPER